jgi:hypothetical protein
MMGQIQQAVQLAKGNPMALMQGPQYQQAMNLIQQAGGDARAAFYQLAQQKGVDPNQILSMLK